MVSHSVIIPNLNGEEYLPDCLKSLKKSFDYSKINPEIILVDNASTDTSPEIFTAFCQKNKIPYQLVSLTKNYGFAGAVNRGVAASKSDWVLVCNNDLKIDKFWLKHLESVLSKNKDPKLAAITGTVLNYNGTHFESRGLKFHYSGKCDNIGNGHSYSSKVLKNYSSKAPFYIWGASAALTAYNRKIFNQLGGFDEDFFAYEEDVDLALKLHNLGYKTLYMPLAISYHLGGATSRKMGNFRNRMDAKNWFYIIWKNYSKKEIRDNLFSIIEQRLRNLSGLIKNTPLKNIPKDVYQTYSEVLKNRKKMLAKNYRPTDR